MYIGKFIQILQEKYQKQRPISGASATGSTGYHYHRRSQVISVICYQCHLLSVLFITPQNFCRQPAIAVKASDSDTLARASCHTYLFSDGCELPFAFAVAVGCRLPFPTTTTTTPNSQRVIVERIHQQKWDANSPSHTTSQRAIYVLPQ